MKVNPPKCAECLYGVMMKRPCCTKYENKRGYIREAFSPGECISFDHTESITPCFIAQLKVKPTNQRYCAETIVLDHYSDLTYVHLQMGLSSEKIVKAKRVFEAYARICKILAE